MSSRLQRVRPVLVALLYLAFPGSAAALNIMKPSTPQIYKDTIEAKDQKQSWKGINMPPERKPSDSDDQAPAAASLTPANLSGSTINDHPAGAPENKEGVLERGEISAKSKAIENVIFDDFAKEYAMYYACENKNATDWYLKRTFEHLKNTIGKTPELEGVTYTKDQILAKIESHLNGASLSQTSRDYLSQSADFALRLSNKLVKKRTENPNIDWKDPLGGGRGILSSNGLSDESAEWNKVGKGALFTVPAKDIRGQDLCKDENKLSAKARDVSNRVLQEELTYDVSKAEQHHTNKDVKKEAVAGKTPNPEDPNPIDQAEKIAAATVEPESSVKIDNFGRSDGTLVKGDLPTANQENIKDTTDALSKIKELGLKVVDKAAKTTILAGISEVQSELSRMVNEHESHNREAIESGHAAFLKYGTTLRKQFTDMPKDRPGVKSVYKAIWEACLERKDLLATSFERKPIAWKNAFETALQADETCKEACSLSGALNCP